MESSNGHVVGAGHWPARPVTRKRYMEYAGRIWTRTDETEVASSVEFIYACKINPWICLIECTPTGPAL